ncbi:hypothetical protein GLOTRDRAFT_70590 [Gloeophyllum trabeum ATCC 11539]|uniref:Phospholipid/glycerol acyltransferase domain-containing protein n=1 Tax=Gloeophyllum trabeum (strain ATCC 11539 / FP-39264 / Madison 617) TaxID=670483 RepID=S7QIW9_GLOTA|nr:uncharacterized protein GLOTRDRAFT_70590 [Gloeophyllum trabeum ATCC 11539]EPQ59288.1 hypothetical protein GLOTRDRAFT_70590 [Gloeophyllum trabeum ATCC 11539]
MEKFSAFRDPGTGIQPFLTPVPPLGSDSYGWYLFPFQYLLGVVRFILVVLLTLLYLALVQVLCLILAPVPPLYRIITWFFTAIITRLALLVIGLWWIPVEVVTRKRGRSTKAKDSWNPTAGDIIVSNWVSWTELLWLAFRFNPIFLIPVASAHPQTSQPLASSPISHTPGRRTGTGSAAISSPMTRAPVPRVPLTGFRQVSLMTMIKFTGYAPSDDSSTKSAADSLDDILARADRPVVLFPECTTSNGRGLLRFSDVLLTLKDKQSKLFLMCIRYDPPTDLSPSLAHPIPSSPLNPLGHLFTLCASVIPLTMMIRLLSPASFEPADHSPGARMAEAEEAVASIGKIKRTGMGWEDKAAFLEFYWGTRKSRR